MTKSEFYRKMLDTKCVYKNNEFYIGDKITFTPDKYNDFFKITKYIEPRTYYEKDCMNIWYKDVEDIIEFENKLHIFERQTLRTFDLKHEETQKFSSLVAEAKDLNTLRQTIEHAIKYDNCFTIGDIIITMNGQGEAVYRQNLVYMREDE